MDPIWGEEEVVGGQQMAPFERAMVVFYRFPIVTVALCNHWAAICDRMSPTLKSTGVGQFGRKFRGVPLGVDP